MSTLHVVSPTQDLETFLAYLYTGLDGYVYIPTKNPALPPEEAWSQNFFQWPTQARQIKSFIQQNAAELNVYIAPAIFSAESATKDNFKATNVVWAEFDGQLPTDLGDIPSPTLTVQSSHESHQHWYWRLEQPLTDIAKVEGINRSITYTLGADASGWDINQVLRPPTTINHKQGKHVEILTVTDITVSTLVFNTLSTIEEFHLDLASAPIPDVTDVILKYAWPKEAADLMMVKSHDRGTRSSALMRLGYFCAEIGMDDHEMFAVIRNADDRWGKFKGRTDRDRRLVDLIARVRTKYPTLEEVVEHLPAFGFKSLLDSHIEIKWVIPDLLQEQGYMLFTGPSGIGKTTVSLRFAIALALGKSWLEYEITEPRKILFISLEMGHADIKYFLTTMAKTLTAEEMVLLETNFIMVPHGEALYLDNPGDGRKLLEEQLELHKPDGVFIDSTGSTTVGDLSSEGPVKAIMDYNDRLRKKYNVFVWWIHHMRKAQAENRKPNKLSDVYGNQYLVNRATSVYSLWGAKDKIEVIPLKKRLAAMEPPWKIKRTAYLDFIKVDEQPFEKAATLAYRPDEEEPDDKPVERKGNGLVGGI